MDGSLPPKQYHLYVGSPVPLGECMESEGMAGSPLPWESEGMAGSPVLLGIVKEGGVSCSFGKYEGRAASPVPLVE